MIVRESVEGYDLIGDVHGCGVSLRMLLSRLGYSKRNGVYQHPRRKVIFIGDLVDRGPYVREVLEIAHDMVQAGYAHIVMGNHEFNLLSYCTPSRNISDGKSYLRAHTQRHRRILQESLQQLDPYPADKSAYLDWIKQMPLFLEFEQFRVVHACWHQELIDEFKARYDDNRMNDEILHRAAVPDSFEWVFMDRILRGTHLRLPNDEVMISRDGFKRKFFRTKFWANQPSRYIDVVFQPDPLPEHVARMPLTEQNKRDLIYYGRGEKTLFIGHYWCEGEPKPLTPNIACLDYSAVKYGKLVAYRYDFEAQLSADKFIWVDVSAEVRSPI
ncbi:metallophosphoesterase [Neptunomonas marina]|uniref:Serine/threonine protein phosphatase n=1 Tax=Neptunomonas marina TaxID=1815562 RepID=A0A437QD00_9GAMM|nr:metallophosphoesterase [Neptunomonas marina]RVU32417.1 serine/threonine protein phosphatase [Neptunomonas marina]